MCHSTRLGARIQQYPRNSKNLFGTMGTPIFLTTCQYGIGFTWTITFQWRQSQVNFSNSHKGCNHFYTNSPSSALLNLWIPTKHSFVCSQNQIYGRFSSQCSTGFSSITYTYSLFIQLTHYGYHHFICCWDIAFSVQRNQAIVIEEEEISSYGGCHFFTAEVTLDLPAKIIFFQYCSHGLTP